MMEKEDGDDDVQSVGNENSSRYNPVGFSFGTYGGEHGYGYFRFV
eukprot:CAMPEP_0172576352 /NCGR_PEP_ID=MMETSP1067-20121228/137678_1 /TAXON_ID=265564 ORGANISM="Thalassiosira punctigera, Strain Tpunct2005C2" /NCGR_SAMPLE_ID=MMETSP1067 /ASSEMBLY_ACC=CAM_ASM_000444 /LENGTH=44 /DNA_ID= /DNA_START= /DNA_END= /DNA_ORIENTATION=